IALRTFGRYDEALVDLMQVTVTFPRDRVVWNAIGRVRFLQRRYREAVEAFRKTLAIDPEDVTAHYNLMLCERGLHDEAAAKAEEAFYARFKADESAQAVTGDFRRLHPDDNRERQAIHEHDSTWTPENLAAASAKNYASPGPPGSARGASYPDDADAARPPVRGRPSRELDRPSGWARRLRGSRERGGGRESARLRCARVRDPRGT